MDLHPLLPAFQSSLVSRDGMAHLPIRCGWGPMDPVRLTLGAMTAIAHPDAHGQAESIQVLDQDGVLILEVCDVYLDGGFCGFALRGPAVSAWGSLPSWRVTDRRYLTIAQVAAALQAMGWAAAFPMAWRASEALRAQIANRLRCGGMRRAA
jgi:hypothetical protein